jgi:CNT family concentrative nucleoside transporter
MERFAGLLGMAFVLAAAYYFSTNRKAIQLKTVLWGLGLQIAFAIFVLKTEVGVRLFRAAGRAVEWVLHFSFQGSEFVFGPLGRQEVPLVMKDGSTGGFFFAFQVLPTIIFVAVLMSVLYYFGVLQLIIKLAARVMTKLMGASGAESLNVAASIFMGQTEAPLTIRPFLPKLTRSEVMTIMTSGMAHVSGGVMAAYISFGAEARHLLTAVIMTAPGTLLIAKMLVPEEEHPVTAGRVEMLETDQKKNLLSAIAHGTSDGLQMAINVAAMLIAFIALVGLGNGILGVTSDWLAARGFHYFPVSIQQILGFAFAPVAWLIGVPWQDCVNVGNLLGTKMVINEFVAYLQLGQLKEALDPRSFTIATFALCGFANFSSIGIQIGGIGALAPNKREELARFGLRAMLAGTLANLMAASIAGILL